jgi:hypothetical protein
MLAGGIPSCWPAELSNATGEVSRGSGHFCVECAGGSKCANCHSFVSGLRSGIHQGKRTLEGSSTSKFAASSSESLSSLLIAGIRGAGGVGERSRFCVDAAAGTKAEY